MYFNSFFNLGLKRRSAFLYKCFSIEILHTHAPGYFFRAWVDLYVTLDAKYKGPYLSLSMFKHGSNIQYYFHGHRSFMCLSRTEDISSVKNYARSLLTCFSLISISLVAYKLDPYFTLDYLNEKKIIIQFINFSVY